MRDPLVLHGELVDAYDQKDDAAFVRASVDLVTLLRQANRASQVNTALIVAYTGTDYLAYYDALGDVMSEVRLHAPVRYWLSVLRHRHL